MSRMYGQFVSLVGCIISFLSFCLLPYLVVPYTSFEFTGLQLINSGSQIPLPHYFTVQAAGIGNIQGVLQNNPSVDLLLVLIILMGLLAIYGCVLRLKRGQDKGIALGIVVGFIFTFFFSLCSLAGNVATSFDFMDAHANTLSGIVHGSLFTTGFLGIVLGVIVAFIGSVITLRSERQRISYSHWDMYRDFG